MWWSALHWSAVTCVCIFTGPSCSRVCHQEMLMRVRCSLSVCIPGEILGAEAGERNESCAVNHSLPRRRRGETHAESNNCIQSTPQQHNIQSDTSPPARMQSAAQTLGWMKGFLTQTEWHISTLSRFLTRSHFTSRAISFPSSFVPWPTCFHKLALMAAKAGNVGWRGCKMKGWSHKVHTVIPPAFTAEPLPLKPALFHSLFHTPSPS